MKRKQLSHQYNQKNPLVQFNDRKLKENKKLMNLKIVIPEALQQTYEFLSSLEK